MPAEAFLAAGTLGAGLLGSRSSNKAADKQAQANKAALEWEKQRFGTALGFYNRDRPQWEAGRNWLFKQYGIDIPGYGAYSPAQMPSTRPQGYQRQPVPEQPPQMAQPQSLGSMLNAPAGLIPQLPDRVR